MSSLALALLGYLIDLLKQFTRCNVMSGGVKTLKKKKMTSSFPKCKEQNI